MIVGMRRERWPAAVGQASGRAEPTVQRACTGKAIETAVKATRSCSLRHTGGAGPERRMDTVSKPPQDSSRVRQRVDAMVMSLQGYADQHAIPEGTGLRPFPAPGDTDLPFALLPLTGDTGARTAPLPQEGGTGPRPVPRPPADHRSPAGHRPEDGTPPRRAAQSEPAEEDQPPVPEVPSTPSGLPVRVPQANLAPPLRTDEPPTAAEPAGEAEEQVRSPAEIQRIMGSYQRGTQRGRSEAAEALGNNAEGEDEQ
ncbi:hypothetical protein ACIBF1_41340 [Spirillospora sp. NPDC050679]